MAPKKSAVLEQEPVNPFEVVQGYVSQLKAPEDKPAFEVCTAILKMKTIPNDIQVTFRVCHKHKCAVYAGDTALAQARGSDSWLGFMLVVHALTL